MVTQVEVKKTIEGCESREYKYRNKYAPICRWYHFFCEVEPQNVLVIKKYS